MPPAAVLTTTTARPPARPAAAPLDEQQRALVREHLPVVGYLVSEVMSRMPAHVHRDDLVSAGQLALVLAARGFDPTLGVPFGHYARQRIRGALLDELRSADWASRGARTRAKRLAQAEEALAATLGRWPSDVELAAELTADVRELAQTRDAAQRSVVLSLQGLTDAGAAPEAMMPAESHLPDPEQAVVAGERRRYLVAAVGSLPDRLRHVVEQYFLGDRPMAEIAAHLGVTESRVSQLRAEALELLRDGMNTHLEPQRVREPERPDGVVARRRSAYYAQVAAMASAGGVATLPQPSARTTRTA